MKLTNRNILHLILLILTCGIMSCESDNAYDHHITNESDHVMFNIEIPKDQVFVNTDIECHIFSPSLLDGQSILVVLRNNLRLYQWDLTVRKGRSSFVINRQQSYQSGLYTICVYFKGTLMNEKSFSVLPDKAQGKIETFFGPKSLFVSDDDQSMIVTMPRDEFGNPSSNQVVFKSFTDQSLIELGSEPIDNLISYKTVSSMEKKGRKTLIAATDDAAIREQELIVKAGSPKTIKLNLLDHVPFADNRQHMHLVTEPILDELGNIVDDGTILFYSVRDAKSGLIQANYSSMTINGVSTIYIKNPKVASEVIITAHHYNSCRSNDISLAFESYIVDFNLLVSNNTVLTGPIKAKTGQLITDGTIGLAEILSSGEQFEIESLNGQVTFDIDPSYFQSDQDSLMVTIGGVSKSIAINYGEGI